jgi:hypothetical protein
MNKDNAPTSVSAAVKQAAANFMIISVTVGLWRGWQELPQAAAKAAAEAGVTHDKTQTKVPVLGEFHHKLSDVVSKFARTRNLLDELAVGKFQKGTPQRLIYVNKTPDILAKLIEQKNLAYAARDAFIPQYEEFLKQALPSHGKWRSEVAAKLPSADELAAKFYIEIHDPKPVPAMDMAAYGCVPTSTMGQIVEASNAALARTLEDAKMEAIDRATKTVQKIADQLSKDQARLSPSLLTNARQATDNLRDMAIGYDNDIKLTAIADMIDNDILNVSDVAQWKGLGKRAIALDAAKKTVSNLSVAKKAPPIADIPAATESSIIAGGMLNELL